MRQVAKVCTGAAIKLGLACNVKRPNCYFFETLKKGLYWFQKKNKSGNMYFDILIF